MNVIQFLRLLPLLIVLLISAVLATGIFNRTDTQGSMVGKTLPPFNIDLVADAQQKMTQYSWRGQVAVVNIFATWCKPCLQEHPVLMRLAQSARVNVYGIAWRDTPENVVRFLNQAGNPYQIVGNDQFGRTTSPFALSGVPETFVIDRDGVVRYHFISALTDEEVVNHIVPLVDELNASHIMQNAPQR